MKIFLRRAALVIVTIFYSTLNALAEVDGRWYSLDEGSSSPSPFGMVVGGIICAALGIVFAYGYFSSDKRQNDSDNFGCMTIAMIIAGIIGVLVGFSRCSG